MTGRSSQASHQTDWSCLTRPRAVLPSWSVHWTAIATSLRATRSEPVPARQRVDNVAVPVDHDRLAVNGDRMDAIGIRPLRIWPKRRHEFFLELARSERHDPVEGDRPAIAGTAVLGGPIELIANQDWRPRRARASHVDLDRVPSMRGPRS